VALTDTIKMDFRLSFLLNTDLFGQLKTTNADLEKRLNRFFLIRSQGWNLPPLFLLQAACFWYITQFSC